MRGLGLAEYQIGFQLCPVGDSALKFNFALLIVTHGYGYPLHFLKGFNHLVDFLEGDCYYLRTLHIRLADFLAMVHANSGVVNLSTDIGIDKLP